MIYFWHHFWSTYFIIGILLRFLCERFWILQMSNLEYVNNEHQFYEHLIVKIKTLCSSSLWKKCKSWKGVHLFAFTPFVAFSFSHSLFLFIIHQYQLYSPASKGIKNYLTNLYQNLHFVVIFLYSAIPTRKTFSHILLDYLKPFSISNELLNRLFDVLISLVTDFFNSKRWHC